MKKQDKITSVQNLAVKIKDSKSLVATNYRGLTVAQISQLRNSVKKSGGELIVVKNTLLERALKESDSGIDEIQFTEPTAIVIAYDDQIAPLKAIREFAKGTDLLALKFGILEHKLLTKEDVEKLSLLPSKNELLVRLLQILQTPQIRFASLLTTNQSKLLFILKNSALQKKGGVPPQS